MNGASSANIPYKNELRDRQGCGEYGRRHKPLLDAAINDIRIRFEGKTVEVEFIDILPRMNAGDSRILRFGFLFATTKQERRGR